MTIILPITFIKLTENIRKATDDENIGCGFFVNFKKLLIL